MSETNTKSNDSALRPLMKLSGHSALYGIGMILRQLTVYLAVPLFTGNMPVREYGVVAVMSSYLAFLNVLTNVGVPAATFRLYNDKDDKEYRQKILSTGQVLTALFSLAASAVMILFAPQVSQFSLKTTEYAPVVIVVAIQLFIESLVNYGVIILRIQVRPMANTIQSVVHGVSQILFALYFVLHLKMGALGYFYGFTLGALIGLLYIIWLLKDVLAREVSKPHMREMLLFGAPFLPSTIALWVMNMSDRALISWLLNLDSAAVYDVGYRIGLLGSIAILPVNAAWGPYKFTIMDRPDAKEVYKNAVTFFLFLFFSAALGVIMLQKYLVAFFSPESYAGAVNIVMWVAIAQAVFGLHFSLSVGLHIAKKPGLFSAVASVAAVVNVVMNLILLPIIGILGAAISTLGGYLVLSIGSYVIGNRHYYFPLDYSRIFKIGFSFFLLVFLFWLIDRYSLRQPLDAVLHALGFVVYLAALVLTRFITLPQLRMVWDFIRTRSKDKNKLSMEME